MNIKHRPIFETEKVIAHYSEKDGVPVTYICTTAIGHGTTPVDIFYREAPHPEFGNRYFGLYWGMTLPFDGAPDGARQVMITNADKVEELVFEMVDIDGELHYSTHRHDYHTVKDVSIDGGRAYLKRTGNLSYPVKTLIIRNGEFIEKETENV